MKVDASGWFWAVLSAWYGVVMSTELVVQECIRNDSAWYCQQDDRPLLLALFAGVAFLAATICRLITKKMKMRLVRTLLIATAGLGAALAVQQLLLWF